MTHSDHSSESGQGSLAGTGLRDKRLLSEWFAIGWSSEVADGKMIARHILGRDLVLWRTTGSAGQPGKLHCWLDLCIHRGAKLSLGVIQAATQSGVQSAPKGGEGNCLICPYHGWKYAESGQCTFIPAQPDVTPPSKARATVFKVEERYGAIWVCFGDQPGKLPEYPIAGEPGFRTLLAGPYKFRALGPRLIENLLDVAHLGIVHAGLLGDADHGQIQEYEVTMGSRGPEANRIRIYQPNPDGTGKGALVTYHYFVQGPLTAGFIKLGVDGSDGCLDNENEADGKAGKRAASHDSGQRLAFLAQVVPIDREYSEMRMIIALNYGHETSDAELIAFQDRVVEQDRAVVESQRPELLPLDLQAELHLRSDRMAIAYRRWLREIGFTYGVA